MARFNGTEFKLFDSTSGDVEFDQQSELEINLETDTFDVTSKDSAGWEESEYGTRRWSGSCEIIVDFQESTKKGYLELMNAIINRTKIPVTARKSTEATGDVSVAGTILVTSVPITAPLEGKVSTSFSFKGTGALTPASEA